MRSLILCLAAAGLLAGCGCSESDLLGDTATDHGVETLEDPAFDGTWDPPLDGTWDPPPDGTWDPPFDATWDLPVDNLGEPGWRDSTDPFCRDSGWYVMSWDVWSDTRGVFAIVVEMNPGPSTWPTDDPAMAPGRSYVAFNDGTGWSERFVELTGFEDSMCTGDLTGIPGGTLLRRIQDGFMCGEGTMTDGGLTLENMVAQALFVVDDTLAYAILSSGLLLYYDGAGWGPYPPDPIPYGASILWADRSSIFVAGSSGVIMSEEGEGWRIHDTGTIEDVSTLWGFGPDDVWAGTYSGSLLHLSGGIWQRVDWPDMGDSSDPMSCRHRGDSITGMWGSGGVLYFHTSNQIAMWDGAGFTVLGYWPGVDVDLPGGGHDCGGRIGVNAIWGNSADEVFLAVTDPGRTISDCGAEMLLWWDGHAFHWF